MNDLVRIGDGSGGKTLLLVEGEGDGVDVGGRTCDMVDGWSV